METRERYQRQAIQQNKNSLGRLPSFAEMDDPVVEPPKASYQDIKLLKSCTGVERIFKVTHMTMRDRKREVKEKEKLQAQDQESEPLMQHQY